MANINLKNDQLESIYGTLENVQELCANSQECWKGIESLKYLEFQKPYRPYIGSDYQGIFFCGTNLNGGNDSLDAIDCLVSAATDKYLDFGKYMIFKHTKYRGSPFYYYVPLLSYLYFSYSNREKRFNDEGSLTKEQIIEGFRYCALSNLIKCSINSEEGRSKPREAMYRNCIPKFRQELEFVPHRLLITFTYFWGTNFAKEYLGDYVLLNEGNKYRIQRTCDRYLLELEHPLSTRKGSTRAEKFRTYSNAIYAVADVIAAKGIQA